MGTKFILGQEDGTVSGGNARGDGAVDLQMSRSANGSISSTNYSTISGGQNNRISTSTHGTIVGGQNNVVTGLWGVAGGNSNTVGSSGSTAFGSTNTAGYSYDFTVGYYNNASGGRSVAMGDSNSASATMSIALGSESNAYLKSQLALSSGRYSAFNALGEAQQSLLTARKLDTLTTGATTVLSLDGTGTTNLIIPNGNNRAWNVQIDTIAVVTAITGTATGVSVGDCYRETKQLLFKRIGATSSIVGTVDTTAVKSDTSMSTAALTVTAGASQEMALTFTSPSFSGGGSLTIRVVSKVSLVEVAY